jgi:ribosomal protein S18 acetylase RimI-like enzyme
LDEQGRERAELVWRVATGHTAEITEFGIHDSQDRRKGWGTKLLKTALEDMQNFFRQHGHEPRRVYLFCEARNGDARAFYEAQGFILGAILKDFYVEGDAVLYVLPVVREDRFRKKESQRKTKA